MRHRDANIAKAESLVRAAADGAQVIASNRISPRSEGHTPIPFYGVSFITDATGAKVAEGVRTMQTDRTATFDLDALRDFRTAWGCWRDRRLESYGGLTCHRSA